MVANFTEGRPSGRIRRKTTASGKLLPFGSITTHPSARGTFRDYLERCSELSLSVHDFQSSPPEHRRCFTRFDRTDLIQQEDQQYEV